MTAARRVLAFAMTTEWWCTVGGDVPVYVTDVVEIGLYYIVNNNNNVLYSCVWYRCGGERAWGSGGSFCKCPRSFQLQTSHKLHLITYICVNNKLRVILLESLNLCYSSFPQTKHWSFPTRNPKSGMEMFFIQLLTNSDTFVRKLYSVDWMFFVPVGIGFGKLHCHVCGNEL